MLKKLQLSNFRNYSNLDLSFEKAQGLTYLIGDNGQGKTNVLEAIYMLALAKSFRVSEEENLIKWGEEFGRVRGVFERSGPEEVGKGGAGVMEIFLGLPPQPRRVFKFNEVKVSATNFVGQVRVVFFHPEDLNMLYLGPDLRRRYLDILIIQKSREYFAALRKFRKIKEQRNALLSAIREGNAGEKDLDIWDEQLVREGALIWLYRANALSYINGHLSEQYGDICKKSAHLELRYINNLGLNFDLMSLTNNLAEVYAEEMKRSRGRDLASGHTLVGPHRDDVEFLLEGRAIMAHASRGEFRTILLALKLIEMEYFSEDGARPILLLDDVFSELDHERQRFLLERVVHYQTFITTTKDSAVINQEKLLAGDFIEINQGRAELI